MNVIKYVSINSNDNCPSCFESMANASFGDVIAHNQLGNSNLWHPIHKKCAISWLEAYPNGGCPECRTQIDSSSLISLKDRITRELKLGLNDVKVGGIIGSIGATLLTIPYTANTFGMPVVLATGIIGALAGVIFINSQEQDFQNQNFKVSPEVITGSILTGGFLMGGFTLGFESGLAGGIAGIGGAIFGAAVGGQLERKGLLPHHSF